MFEWISVDQEIESAIGLSFMIICPPGHKRSLQVKIVRRNYNILYKIVITM